MPLLDASRRLRQQLLRPTYLSTLGSMFASTSAQLALIVSGICAARILGVHDRGQLALFAIVPLILTVMGALGVPVATTYFIARDPENARGIVSVVRKLALIQTAVIMTVHLVVLFFLYRSASGAVQLAAATTFTLGPTKLAQDYGGGILQGEQRFRAFNITRVLPNFAYASLVLAVFVAGGHLLAVTLAYVIGTATVGALTLTIALRGLPSSANPERNPSLKAIVTFGVKALFGAIYPTEAFQLDQAFVGVFLSRVALGTYVVGVSFANLPRFIAQSIGLIAYPHVAAIDDPKDARRAVWRFGFLVMFISLIICVTLELATPHLVPLFFGAEFRKSVEVTQILLISSFIVSIRRVLGDGMRGAGYPILGTYAEISALVLLLPALLILIPADGLTGAAVAMPIAAVGGLAVLLIGIAVTRRQEIARVHVDAPPKPVQAGG
jgi:O-antigen/teichoic acid export membrane protein